MFEDPYGISAKISGVAFKRKLIAFLMTGLAVLTGLCLVFPLSVKEYQSVASILITKSDAVGTIEELRPMLAHAIQQELQQKDFIKQAQLARNTDGSSIDDDFKLAVQEVDGNYLLQVAMNGKGTPAEFETVRDLAEKVAYRFSTGRGPGNSEVDMRFKVALEKYRSGAIPSTNADFNQAEYLLSKAEDDLQQAKQMSDSNQLSLDSGSLNPYQLASTQKFTSPSTEQLGQAVNSIDLASLRDVIDRLKSQTQASGGINEPFRVVGVDEPRALPVNGVPNLGGFLMMLATAGLVGTITAWHFNPFVNRGFEDIHAVSDKLGVPVVGLIEVRTNTNSLDETNWANRITLWATWFLIFALAAAVLLLMYSTTVREAFVRNPFYGLSEMFRTLSGN